MQINITFLRFIGICATLFIFGLIYGYSITRFPFPPKLTWLSVLIGDFVTDLGTGAQLLLFTGDPVLAALPIINHGLTGGPMILAQVVKHALQDGGEVIPENDEVIDGDGTQTLAELGH